MEISVIILTDGFSINKNFLPFTLYHKISNNFISVANIKLKFESVKKNVFKVSSYFV